MSFTTRINNYTNSVTAENLVDALKKGVDYTLGVVQQNNPEMLRLFALNISTGTRVADIDWANDYKASYLLDVSRNDKYCKPVSEHQKADAINPKSIYYALPNDPVYWLSSGEAKINVKPTPASDTVKIDIVISSAGRTITDSTESIRMTNIALGGVTQNFTADTCFPKSFYELVVLHASDCILTERLADFRASIPAGLDAEFDDALAKAKTLFDDGANIQGDNAGASMSVQYWLSDEDEDMSSATLQAISSEIQRANSYALKFKTDLEKIATDYQWTQGQLQLINSKKQEFIQSQILQGPQKAEENKA
tara:strand:+ start:700 stop:1626 length:927 start_codon:yes stop_codon:yes gene_type:complete